MYWSIETEENMSKLLLIHPVIHLFREYLLNIEYIKGICFTQIVGKDSVT